jgi:hypothetical protein
MGNMAISGDTATWVGSIGIWIVGFIAAFIALIQYNTSRFRPRVQAYWTLPNRVVIRVINRGSGGGNLERIDLLKRVSRNE